jgi:signal transduction histidine kinase
LIDYHPAGTYRSLSFSEIMAGKISSGQIANKIVIVGRDTEGSTKDYVQTPYSKEQMAMTLLELHANMFDTAIQNRAVIPCPGWLNFLVTYLISILIVYVVLAVKPVYGLGILVGTIAAFILVSLGLLAIFNVAASMSHPLLAAFICYYFLIPYRLIVENRRSWEYYQRNKILSQVEELKSNFLSMMSHDIKTPLARIQGMVDVIRRDSQPLGEQQKSALDSIKQSANDLTHFISSLLDVGRVESQGINLHKSSKDINGLLGEVIEKVEFLAREKNITIETEFEPMFSVKLDVSLMKQVFSNLLENAIKYSKPDSKILVSTEENNGEIVVQISDQGFGIPDDELQNIFMKFYRSKEANASKIKGTGVGLYLAKYFVELHNGKIEVESKINQGSTFTVNLPMDL